MSSSMSSSTVVDRSGVLLCPLAQRAEVVTAVSMDLSESGVGASTQRALIGQMHQQLDELLGARDKTEQLLRSIINVGSDLDLDATLHQIVTAAMELTGARYGALAVHGTDGAWTQFVHAGMDPETIRADRPFARWAKVFLVFRSKRYRLCGWTISARTRRPSGCPNTTPRCALSLAVPIMIRGTVVAGLYLADDQPSQTFTESDEVTARTLAAAAASSHPATLNCSTTPASRRSGRTPAAKSSPHCFRVSTHICGHCSGSPSRCGNLPMPSRQSCSFRPTPTCRHRRDRHADRVGCGGSACRRGDWSTRSSGRLN